jgi:AraC-like DNA-binding protein
MAVLAVFQPDPLSLARITRALSDQHEVVTFPDWAALRDGLERLPADGCLLDPYHTSHPVGLTEIRHLRERHGSLAIIVYADFGGHEMDLFTLGRFQIDGVVPAGGYESVRQIQETVADALVSSVAQRVLSSLERRLSRFPLDCLRWAIENSHRAPGVPQIAEAFARSPGSFARRLRREGAPTAGRLLLWGRLFRAAHMLGERGATVERVAYAVGYSSGAALARALRRETGHPPGEVLRRGGIGCVLDGFMNREIRTLTPRTAGRWRTHPRRAFRP